MFVKLVVINLLFINLCAQGAKILGVIPTPSFSHQVAFRPIWRELSLRGHQVTLITTDPINDPSLTNLTEIDIGFSYEVFAKYNYNERILEFHEDFIKMVNFFIAVYEELNEIIFSQPEIKKIVHDKSVDFDLVMIEYLNPCYFPFAQRFKDAAFIALASLDVSYVGHDCFGNPSHPVINPDVMMPAKTNLSFFDRLKSAGLAIILRLYNIFIMAELDTKIGDYFESGYPPVAEIACKADLLFLSVNPVLDPVRAVVPAVINIGGGMHIQPPKPLPKHLQEYLDSSKNGVIYFSLGGTNVQSKIIPEALKNVIKETFAELPYDILWKYEDPELPGKPSNVRIEKWLPQQDVLRHPNIKLFISQGGLQSMEEAIFSHVPILGMPFFGDQRANVKKLVEKGLGLEVDRYNLHKNTFKSAILEVISNPKYKENVEKVAELSLDQPMTGLERAVWWTEYALRHKGAQHLKGPATKIPWYQYFLLDVIGLCAAIVIVISFIVVKTVKLLYWACRKMCRKPKVKIN